MQMKSVKSELDLYGYDDDQHFSDVVYRSICCQYATCGMILKCNITDKLTYECRNQMRPVFNFFRISSIARSNKQTNGIFNDEGNSTTHAGCGMTQETRKSRHSVNTYWYFFASQTIGVTSWLLWLCSIGRFFPTRTS